MTQFLQVVIDGMASGAIYGALALALVLIFRSTGLVNFAQGEIALFATYIVWQLEEIGIPVWFSIGLGLVAGFGSGVVVERLIIRRVESSSHLTVVIVTLGLFIGFNSLTTYIWGTVIKSMKDPFSSQTINFGGVRVSGSSVGTLAVILTVLLVLALVFRYTKLGLAMRAVASNDESAQFVGINVNRILMFGWGLAAAVGALSGALAAPRLFLEPNLMLSLLLYAFAAAALGGFDSPSGAVLGGLIVGVAEGLAGTYIAFIGSDLKVVVPFILIFTVLLVKPNGLLGRGSVVRA